MAEFRLAGDLETRTMVEVFFTLQKLSTMVEIFHTTGTTSEQMGLGKKVKGQTPLSGRDMRWNAITSHR